MAVLISVLWTRAQGRFFRQVPLAHLVGGLLVFAVVWGLARIPSAWAELRPRYEGRLWQTYTREVVVDRATPKQSVVFLDVDREPPEVMLSLNHIFWSGRMTYLRRPDSQVARAKGYHPYLLSPSAEPYEPLP